MVRQFGRRIVFQTDKREIKYPELEIEFEIEFSDTSEGNAGHIRFFNLANNTTELLEEGKNFLLKAGYIGDVGTILPGIIEKQTTSWEKVDKITLLIVGDNTQAWMNSTINKTWKAGVKSSQIVPDIINETGLTVGDIEIQDDITYEKGKTFSTTCQKALQEIADDTNSKLHSSRGKIYFRPKNKATQQAIIVNQNTGLLSSPQVNKNEEDDRTYTVSTLLNYRIETDSLLQIESRTISGNYRVIKGKHMAEGDDFSTQVEVEKYE